MGERQRTPEGIPRELASFYPTTHTTSLRNSYHRVDKLGFQTSHANFVHELSDKGGVLALLGIPHHPKRQRRADKDRDIVARDAMLWTTCRWENGKKLEEILRNGFFGRSKHNHVDWDISLRWGRGGCSSADYWDRFNSREPQTALV